MEKILPIPEAPRSGFRILRASRRAPTWRCPTVAWTMMRRRPRSRAASTSGLSLASVFGLALVTIPSAYDDGVTSTQIPEEVRDPTRNIPRRVLLGPREKDAHPRELAEHLRIRAPPARRPPASMSSATRSATLPHRARADATRPPLLTNPEPDKRGPEVN